MPEKFALEEHLQKLELLLNSQKTLRNKIELFCNFFDQDDIFKHRKFERKAFMADFTLLFQINAECLNKLFDFLYSFYNTLNNVEHCQSLETKMHFVEKFLTNKDSENTFVEVNLCKNIRDFLQLYFVQYFSVSDQEKISLRDKLLLLNGYLQLLQKMLDAEGLTTKESEFDLLVKSQEFENYGSLINTGWLKNIGRSFFNSRETIKKENKKRQEWINKICSLFYFILRKTCDTCVEQVGQKIVKVIAVKSIDIPQNALMNNEGKNPAELVKPAITYNKNSTEPEKEKQVSRNYNQLLFVETTYFLDNCLFKSSYCFVPLKLSANMGDIGAIGDNNTISQLPSLLEFDWSNAIKISTSEVGYLMKNWYLKVEDLFKNNAFDGRNILSLASSNSGNLAIQVPENKGVADHNVLPLTSTNPDCRTVQFPKKMIANGLVNNTSSSSMKEDVTLSISSRNQHHIGNSNKLFPTQDSTSSNPSPTPHNHQHVIAGNSNKGNAENNMSTSYQEDIVGLSKSSLNQVHNTNLPQINTEKSDCNTGLPIAESAIHIRQSEANYSDKKTNTLDLSKTSLNQVHNTNLPQINTENSDCNTDAHISESETNISGDHNRLNAKHVTNNINSNDHSSTTQQPQKISFLDTCRGFFHNMIKPLNTHPSATPVNHQHVIAGNSNKGNVENNMSTSYQENTVGLSKSSLNQVHNTSLPPINTEKSDCNTGLRISESETNISGDHNPSNVEHVTKNVNANDHLLTTQQSPKISFLDTCRRWFKTPPTEQSMVTDIDQSLVNSPSIPEKVDVINNIISPNNAQNTRIINIHELLKLQDKSCDLHNIVDKRQNAFYQFFCNMWNRDKNFLKSLLSLMTKFNISVFIDDLLAIDNEEKCHKFIEKLQQNPSRRKILTISLVVAVKNFHHNKTLLNFILMLFNFFIYIFYGKGALEKDVKLKNISLLKNISQRFTHAVDFFERHLKWRKGILKKMFIFALIMFYFIPFLLNVILIISLFYSAALINVVNFAILTLILSFILYLNTVFFITKFLISQNLDIDPNIEEFCQNLQFIVKKDLNLFKIFSLLIEDREVNKNADVKKKIYNLLSKRIDSWLQECSDLDIQELHNNSDFIIMKEKFELMMEKDLLKAEFTEESSHIHYIEGKQNNPLLIAL